MYSGPFLHTNSGKYCQNLKTWRKSNFWKFWFLDKVLGGPAIFFEIRFSPCFEVSTILPSISMQNGSRIHWPFVSVFFFVLMIAQGRCGLSDWNINNDCVIWLCITISGLEIFQVNWPGRVIIVSKLNWIFKTKILLLKKVIRSGAKTLVLIIPLRRGGRQSTPCFI